MTTSERGNVLRTGPRRRAAGEAPPQDGFMDDYRAWRLLAPTGLLCVGLGISVVADASNRRRRRESSLAWAAEGTLGLVALNAGLCLFGEAVKRRTLHDLAAPAGGTRQR